MNPLNPILADLFVAELRQQIQDSGLQPRFKVDELALWHAEQKASSRQTRSPRLLKIGPFIYGWPRPQERTKPC
ncbi:MAG: hypothetical protein K6T57_04680 [Thermaceae bacterium]|nr:hypothetical protein [Thermaceae bacterium]